MKIVGLVLITLAGIWLGLSAASGLNRRAAALDAMEKLVARIASQIRYTAAPVGELMLSASRTAEFRRWVPPWRRRGISPAFGRRP